MQSPEHQQFYPALLTELKVKAGANLLRPVLSSVETRAIFIITMGHCSSNNAMEFQGVGPVHIHCLLTNYHALTREEREGLLKVQQRIHIYSELSSCYQDGVQEIRNSGLVLH